MHSPAHHAVLAGGVLFDAARGIGRPAPARGRGPADAWLSMRPSAFLALATPLHRPRGSLAWLGERIRAGEAIHPATLRVWTGGAVPAVVGHDGRHRMAAVLAEAGDAEVPVGLEWADGDAEDMPAALVALMRRGMRAQGGRAAVGGPLFGAALLGGRRLPEEDRLPATGIPPPLRSGVREPPRSRPGRTPPRRGPPPGRRRPPPRGPAPARGPGLAPRACAGRRRGWTARR